jgi:probable H4MPT-linked C1 transfer pathway protein
LVDVLGFDIGGANTKAAYLHEENGCITLRVASQYFPVWKNPEKLGDVLTLLKVRLGVNSLDALGVTMTAELSDAYQTKREGVCNILSYVKQIFPDVLCYVLNSSADMVKPEEAENNPISVASANWAATGWLISQHLKNAVILDVGSTSTSIIPIIKGQVAARGKTDLDKLLCGELVYTGSLRTNIAAIVHTVPIKGGVASVSSELFATSGDVHIMLGNITEADFTSETADGKGKTVPEAMARLARVVCADTELLTEQEIRDLAHYVYDQQIKQIVEGLIKVYTYTKSAIHGDIPLVVTGLGKNFLARKAAEKIGATSIIELDTILPRQAILATPAFALAVMVASKIKGAPINWL